MMEFKRGKAPKILKDNKEDWTDNYLNGSAFHWHNKQSQLLEKLKDMTLSHCAFCDDILSPIGSADGQIEHFRPKKKYKRYAFAWNNLYPICDLCNGTKGERFDKLLLRADERDFKFSKWFRFDPNTFELKPMKLNPNWKRAEITIKLYGLNKKISRRQFEYDRIINGEYSNKNYQPFRFI